MIKKSIIIGLSINDSPFEEFEFELDETVVEQLVSEYKRMEKSANFDGHDFYDKLKIARPDVAQIVDDAVKGELERCSVEEFDDDRPDEFPLAYINTGWDIPFRNWQYYVRDEQYNTYKYDFLDFIDEL